MSFTALDSRRREEMLFKGEKDWFVMVAKIFTNFYMPIENEIINALKHHK